MSRFRFTLVGFMVAFWPLGAAWGGINVWTPVGPTGTSQGPDLSISPSDSRYLFASGGIDCFRSTDRAANWAYTGSCPGNIVFDARDPQTVYLVAYLDPLQRSRDGGRTWQSLAFPVADLWTWSGDSNVLFASRRGVSTWTVERSREAGSNWGPIFEFPGNLGAEISLAVSPASADSLLVGVRGAGDHSGLYRTRTGGAPWDRIPLPGNDLAIEQVTVAPSRPDHFFVVALEDAGSANPRWVGFRSVDGGNLWLGMQSFGPVFFGAGDSLYSGTRKSTDGGATWRALPGNAPGNVLPDPQVAGRLYANAAETLFVSTDDGATWRGSDRGLTGIRVLAHAVGRGNPTNQYILSAEAGASYLWRRRPGEPFRIAGRVPVFSTGFFGEGVVPDPTRPSTLYVYGRDILVKSTNGGVSWKSLPVPDLEEFPFVTSLAVDPFRPRRLFLATVSDRGETSFRSTDGGESWQSVRTPFGPLAFVLFDYRQSSLVFAGAFNGPLIRSTDAGNTWQSTVLPPTAHLALDPIDARRVYALSGGKLWVSNDWGATFQVKSSAPALRSATAIALHPRNPNIHYISILAPGGYDLPPKILRTTNGGRTYREITGPLADLHTTIFTDPADPETLFATTRTRGVWAITFR